VDGFICLIDSWIEEKFLSRTSAMQIALAPFSASKRAVAAPMPEAPPVIAKTLDEAIFNHSRTLEGI
jgi:hypothetical protein